MALVKEIRSIEAEIADRITGLVAGVQERAANYRVYTRTLKELGDLSDRELNDLGVSRTTIKAVAYEAVYGK